MIQVKTVKPRKFWTSNILYYKIAGVATYILVRINIRKAASKTLHLLPAPLNNPYGKFEVIATLCDKVVVFCLQVLRIVTIL